ncbi:LysR family transcriptional regulator [Marinomonas transparens]|uniref:LysR family transcriptional regulator n=1 Tax=Marinomonas transparens TaxID=2795388 RepID=A0A934JP53_9GAMM|nr:LysR family transcriptional regulator [Marinomonas transparens]MBJ7538063.1 LysR family transcriptional regulator [Marinomonas transparens]
MDIGLAKHLKLNQLRLISVIAEHGQLSIAADEMAMTQPAASRMLSEIEQTIGTRLFVRHAKGMEPTLVGQAVARRAHNLLVELRDLAREVDELKAGGGGTTAIGAVTGAAVGFVIPAVQQLRAISPKAEIDINVDTSDILVRDLIAGHNDFVLARIPTQYDANEFEICPARTESVTLMVRQDHPLASLDKVSVHDLMHFEWVMQSHRAPIREAVEAAFMEECAELPISITNSTSLLALLAILVSSNAIAPIASEVSELLIGNKVQANLKALKLDRTITMSPYYLLQMRGRQLSPIANQLKRLVLAELEQKPIRPNI